MEFANVVLQTLDSAFVSGIATDVKGDFCLRKIKEGDYRLVVSAIGYKDMVVELNGLNKSAVLGSIYVEEGAVELGDVTVTGSNMVEQIDRKLIFPSENQVKHSSNGINLLQQMMLPRLSISAMDNTISTVSGGEVQLRINDITASKEQVLAIQPADVIRIEYMENPGVRYQGADKVINYIVRHHESGGSASVDTRNVVTYVNTNEFLMGKVNYKKSEFTAGYGLIYRASNENMRRNEESFRWENGDVLSRLEEGLPGKWRYRNQWMWLTYNLTDPDKYVLNVSSNFSSLAFPKTQYNSRLFKSDEAGNYKEMTDESHTRSDIPSLDIFFQKYLKNKQSLIFNLVGTYIHSDDGRFYQERDRQEVVTDILTNVSGKKYSVIGEGIYEKRFEQGKLTAGMKHLQSRTDNSYTGNTVALTKMRHSDTYFYVEYMGKYKNLDYVVALGGSYYYMRQEELGSLKRVFFRPRLQLQYKFSPKFSIAYYGELYNSTPSLSQLSMVNQLIDSLQIQRGQADLRPWMGTYNKLTFNYQKSGFNTELLLAHQYERKPVMEETLREEDYFIRTYDNQKSMNLLCGELSIGWQPWKEYLQISLFGGVNHFLSRGNRYSHNHTIWYHNVQLTGRYKQFSLSFQLYKMGFWFSGETATPGEESNMLTLRYNHPRFSVGIGAAHLFYKEFRTVKRNFSTVAPTRSISYKNDLANNVYITFSYNINWGRKHQAGQKVLYNSDTETGIVIGNK